MLPSGDAAVCSGRVSCATAGTVTASNGRAANRLRINFSFEFQPESAAGRQVRRIGAVQCDDRRSEEHTSELQSLMSTSYVVVCFNKKILTKITTTRITITKH